MPKDHFVPKLILRKFSNSEGLIHFYNKELNNISKKVPYDNQLQKTNFYGVKTLSELNALFRDIEINPIFNNPGDNLERALDLCLESPMGNIVNTIIRKFNQKKDIVLSLVGEKFIKEYVAIQHLRTFKFRMISKKFSEKFSLPQSFKDKVIENVSQRNINIKEIIKKKMPDSNRNERRVFELRWKKKLKKNPNLIEEIREKRFEESLDDMIKEAEQDIKDILNHPDKHSANIINIKQRDFFFKRCELNNRNVVIVINLTKIPFVLGDTGIVLMADDPEAKKNLDIFLPIHPRLLIGLSNDLPKNAVIDDNFVRQFNQISRDESYKNVYSSCSQTLKSLLL